MDLTAFPSFMAYPTGSQTVTTSAAAVQANTKVYDNTGSYNTTTYTFTAPIAGPYRFMGQGGASNTSTSRLILGIQVNSTVYNGTQNSDTYSSGTVLLEIDLNVNDTVQFTCQMNPSVTMTLDSGVGSTRWSGSLIV